MVNNYMYMLNGKKILKLYIFVVLYSSILKLVLGRWGTLVSDIATIAMAFLCIYDEGRFKFVYNSKVKYIFISIILIQVVAIFEIINPNITNHIYSLIEYRKSYFQMLSLIVVYWLVKKTKINVVEILKYIGNISIPIIIYGVKQYFWWTEIDNKLLAMNDADFTTLRFAGHIRSLSIFSGPFHYGLFCVLLFSIFVFLTLKEGKRYIFAAVLSVAGIFCSITRTNTVCLLFACCIWYLMFMKNDKREKNILMKLISIGIVLLMMFMLIFGFFDTFAIGSNSPLGSLFNSLSNIEGDTRFTGRIIRWVKAINAIVEHPFIGYGVGAAADTMEMHNISKVYVTSHNMVLKIWMEVGLVGLMLYMTVFFKSLKKIMLINKEEYFFRALFYALLSSVFINGLVGSTIGSFPSMTMFWIFSGVLLAQDYSKS